MVSIITSMILLNLLIIESLGNEWNSPECKDGERNSTASFDSDETVYNNATKTPVEEYWE